MKKFTNHLKTHQTAYAIVGTAIVCTIGGALLYKKLCVPVPLEEAVHVVKDAVESASDVVETVIETSVS